MAIHVIQRGETLWAISQSFGVSINDLIRDNRLPSANALVPGLALYIPREVSPARVYRVRPGDTYWKLADDFRTSIAAIAQANPSVDPTSLKIGEIITIPTAAKMELATFGFVVPYNQPSTIETVSSLSNQLTYVAVAAYSFTRAGWAYVQHEDRELVAVSKQLGIVPLLMIRNLINSSFSPELVGNVLADSALRRNLILSIVNLASQRGYSGVSVDFEFIPPERRNDFNSFLLELKAELGALILHVNLHAKTEDLPENPIVGAYDYRAIGNLADLAAVMTIDYGYPGGPPDPVAPAWWVEQVILYSIGLINPSKLHISFPLYGYNKTVPGNETTALSVLAAQNLAISSWQSIEYDARTESPFYRYWANNLEHVVWFEDIRSYQAKYRLVDLYQLFGVTYWQLSQPAPQNWAFVRDNTRIIKYSS